MTTPTPEQAVEILRRFIDEHPRAVDLHDVLDVLAPAVTQATPRLQPEQVPCPACGAYALEPCWNLRTDNAKALLALQYRHPIKRPHDARRRRARDDSAEDA